MDNSIDTTSFWKGKLTGHKRRITANNPRQIVLIKRQELLVLVQSDNYIEEIQVGAIEVVIQSALDLICTAKLIARAGNEELQPTPGFDDVRF